MKSNENNDSFKNKLTLFDKEVKKTAKIEKENNEEIIKAQFPKNIPQVQFESPNIQKNKEINNSSKDMDINKNDTNSKNLEVKEEAIKIPIFDRINNDKISKSIIGINTQNLGNNKNDIEFDVFNEKQINSELQTNSFCKAFFITSFPKKDAKITEYSQKLKSDCDHAECSFLPGFQPEIIYKYP